MKLIPVMTEESMRISKDGGYTFWVNRELTKFQIKRIIEEIYSVHVVDVRTINFKAGIKRNVRGQKQKVKAQKKAIVFLKKDEKIDVFEEEKKTKKPKTKKETTKK